MQKDRITVTAKVTHPFFNLPFKMTFNGPPQSTDRKTKCVNSLLLLCVYEKAPFAI